MCGLIRQPPSASLILPDLSVYRSVASHLLRTTTTDRLLIRTRQNRRHVLYTVPHAAGSSLQLARHSHLAPCDHWYRLRLLLTTRWVQTKDNVRRAESGSEDLSTRCRGKIQRNQAASTTTTAMGIRASLDCTLYADGLCLARGLDQRYGQHESENYRGHQKRCNTIHSTIRAQSNVHAPVLRSGQANRGFDRHNCTHGQCGISDIHLERGRQDSRVLYAALSRLVDLCNISDGRNWLFE